MTEVVILPGLDGTTVLLEPFMTQLRRLGVVASAIDYPVDRALGYAALESLAWSRLPHGRPFVLLGESFSGPLAIRIASRAPDGLRGLVLSTSFAAAPVPMLRSLAGLARFAPTRLPDAVLAWWLLGRWATPELQRDLRQALRTVQPSVLRTRAAETLRIDVRAHLAEVRVPTLCLRATGDRLLSSTTQRDLLAGLGDASALDIPGPHLLLQTAGERCAKAIAAFLLRSAEPGVVP